MTTEIDPELMEWVRDFTQEREQVTVEDIAREFFPDDAGAPYLYLDALKADKLITRDPESGEYHWAYKPEGRPSLYLSHWACTHPHSPWARELCRREHGYAPDLDFSDKQRRGRWGKFVDGEIHYLTTAQIRELAGPTPTTPAQFERRLRVYASNYGLRCSARQTGTGLVFCLGGTLDRTDDLSDYLPAEVREPSRGCNSQEVRSSVSLQPTHEKFSLPAYQFSHAECSHPTTRYERAKCRTARKNAAAAS
ncbi:hypothetical protein ACOKM5_25220 [Streptomyces sp. BH097]|uniref:hypothetical protein n=1 Tax=Streptomyces sp. BH097 TaxID=3410406 RepID=UPI003CF4E9C3